MAIQLVELYQADTGKWYARLLNDATGQTAYLKYTVKPTAAQARQDVINVFNPPTVNVPDEDGTTVAVVASQAISLSLSAAQKTAIANAESVLNQFVDAIAPIAQQLSWADIQALRAHSPLLDGLYNLIQRLR